MAALTERDRRLHPRYTVQVQMGLRLEGNDVPMRLATTDLGRAGCYIELMMPSPLALTFKPRSGSTGTRSSYRDAS